MKIPNQQNVIATLLFCSLLGSWPVVPSALTTFRRQQCPPEADQPPTVRNLIHTSDAETHVVYAIDSGRSLDGLLSSIVSLSQFVKNPARCHIHILAPPSEKQRVTSLMACFTNVALSSVLPQLSLHELMPLSPSMEAAINRSQSVQGTPGLLASSVFARVYLDRYFPGLERVIWLDTDTIVKGDIAELYSVHMKYALAAVPLGGWPTERTLGQTLLYTNNSDLVDKLAPLNANAQSFNSGVLVLDLRRWKREGYGAKYEQLFQKLAGRDLVGDQVTLNLLFQDKYDALSWRWNVLNLGFSPYVFRSCIDGARILHWNGQKKPWLDDERIAKYLPLYARFDLSKQCDANDG